MMPVKPLPDILRQQQMVHALCEYFPGKTSVVETHISWVLLTGRHAYKIKKALNLDFLDFSTLEARHFYCLEELRINRRLAPDIYLDVVAIGGSTEYPVPGDEPAIEYAVHMRRFARSSMMDRLLARGRVTAKHMDNLAAAIAGFHAALPSVAVDSPFGSTAAIQAAALQNFTLLAQMLDVPSDLSLLKRVSLASAIEFSACEQLFRRRVAEGCVRECHGDLHLGNIVLLDDTPIPFDGIEFNASLRWIDVINEISFTVMDLLKCGQPQLAWRFLNAYLEGTGDYSGIGVLRFYLAYRAMVRAKVTAIRASQEKTAQKNRELKVCRSYLDLALDCLTRRSPKLIITHGLPGCGKSTFAQIALEWLGAIRIRSDVERKRLFGLSALANSDSQADIYGEHATSRTYARLYDLARQLITAGFSVIVDAAFLRHAEREHFRALAREMGVPFVIASLRADEAILAERLTERLARADDASEANTEVLRNLQAAQEPLQAEEPVMTFINNGDTDTLRTATEAWASSESRLLLS